MKNRSRKQKKKQHANTDPMRILTCGASGRRNDTNKKNEKSSENSARLGRRTEKPTTHLHIREEKNIKLNNHLFKK